MRILMYHEVTRGQPQEIHAVSQDQFSAQMRWLHESGFATVGLDDWPDGPSGAGPRVTARSVAITFDDGYRDNYANAWPILVEQGLRATVFLVAGRLGQTSVWRPGALGQAPLMGWSEVREMAEAGICFGSHTISHADLTALDSDAVTQEITGARERIEQALGRPVESISYPYSRLTPTVKRLVQQAGYRVACSCPTGYVGDANRDPYDLRRITVLATDQLTDFAEKVRGDWQQKLSWYRRQLGAWRRRWMANT